MLQTATTLDSVVSHRSLQPLIGCRLGPVTSKSTGTPKGRATTFSQTQIRKTPRPTALHACRSMCSRQGHSYSPSQGGRETGVWSLAPIPCLTRIIIIPTVLPYTANRNRECGADRFNVGSRAGTLGAQDPCVGPHAHCMPHTQRYHNEVEERSRLEERMAAEPYSPWPHPSMSTESA